MLSSKFKIKLPAQFIFVFFSQLLKYEYDTYKDLLHGMKKIFILPQL